MTESDIGALSGAKRSAFQSAAPNARVSLAVSGRTLSNLLDQHKRLAFSTVVDYLDQLSEAIDLAHEQGFIHRSIKPSSILLTIEGQVVLPDLRSGSNRKDPRANKREARWASYENSRVTTLAYLAPEQILEGDILSPEARHISNIAGMERAVDGRADLYSLGIVLYQMVTGVVPFQAQTPQQMALMHLRMPPPSPRQQRPDLPVAAEQVILRALAKRPTDRYARAQDLATAFRVALIAAGIQLDDSLSVGSESFPEEELLDPFQQAEKTPADGSSVIPSQFSGQVLSNSPVTPSLLSGQALSDSEGSLAMDSDPSLSLRMTAQESHDEHVDEYQQTNPIPAVKAPPASPADDATTPASPVGASSPVGADLSCPPPIYRPFAPPEPSAPTDPPAPPAPDQTSTGAQPAIAPPEYNPDQRSAAERLSITPLPSTSTTGMLALSSFQQGNTGTLKLTGPAKIVQVPVAGQPGLYVTGLLPVFPPTPLPGEASPAQGSPNSRGLSGTKWSAFQSFVPIADLSAKARMILTLAIVVLLIVFGSGLFLLFNAHPGQINNVGTRFTASQNVTPNMKATATARAEATATANIILLDPLSQNIHNWPIATTGSMLYVFENGAYHITDNNPTEGAPAILRDEILQGPFAYTLTMEEIKGDDTSINNEFGMIIRANSQTKNGKTITTFYSFEVLNTKNGEYQFWKYDNSTTSKTGPWTKLWHHAFGKEFHQGQGSKSSNTFEIVVNGKSFTLIVNGKQIATVQDNSCSGSLCSSGAVGMLVNLKGTEVAFSNLRLTRM